MKVICINDKWNRKGNEPAPVFLQECTVTITRRVCDTAYYKLAEFPDNLNYLCDMFAILPDQSAHEMAEQEREAIVNIETALT
jgi:hypothetical protein